MTQGNTSYLRFSLEESVWFRKGQEVAELLSISLEPNVTIQEKELYVAIRGSLELTGEYRQVEKHEENEEDELTSGRYVRVSESSDEDCYVFQHYFPVDITIPTNRVNSLHELDVNVDSFDYVLPENNCLKLSADLTVTGVRGHEETSELDEDQNENLTEEEETEEAQEENVLLYRSTEDDELDEDDEEYTYVDESEDQEESYSFSAEARKPYEPAEEEEAVPIHIAYQANKFPSFPAVDETDKINVRGENDDSPISKEEEDGFVENLFESSSSQQAGEYQGAEEQAELEVEAEEDKKNVKMQTLKQKTAKGKGISLAEFFARKTEEEASARMKIYFVQQGESVEQIAERYEISVQQLLKVNQLEAHEEIHDGQVLYIPEVRKPVIHKK
ncbi:stage VI sporulation protein D [Bacillus oleivorans]|uniref:Stage VI sporulation protein D n=1 Tax=Bacillus oleivorans TaxID=1448271 RepID=A0A285CWS5_9BACI|nr:stage VI sporulation protein D [Bacillus oleivorans]SNX71518.1 stage VI sporulation protein D [Bacillus oleivorans]